MQISVCKDFKGIGMGRHRAELIQRLDYVLGELDRRSGHLDQPRRQRVVARRFIPRNMKDRYGQFKRILQEVDQEANEILNRMVLTALSFLVC
jgi:hypothetical protein